MNSMCSDNKPNFTGSQLNYNVDFWKDAMNR